MKHITVKLIAVIITALIIAVPAVCSAAELTDEAYIYYDFEKIGKDAGSANAKAIIVGAPAPASKAAGENGPGGKYLVVDPENYLKISKDDLQFGGDNFSISAWMKFPDDTPDGTFMRIFQTGYWAENSPGFVIAATRNGEEASFANGIAVEKGTDADGTWAFYPTCDNYFDGKWHHFVFAFDQDFGEYAIYLDGEKVLTRIVAVKDSLKANSTWDLALGFFCLDETPMEIQYAHSSLEMGIDEFAIYKKFLTEDEVAAYYAASKDAKAPAAEGTTDEPAAPTDPTDEPAAPQTGFATAIIAVGAILSGAYVSSKRH